MTPNSSQISLLDFSEPGIEAPPELTLLDTTLRDGEQREGVTLTLKDKLRIVQRLDELGISYIEAGFPASNERDRELFASLAAKPLKQAKPVAFGSTCHKHVAAADDEGLRILALTPTEIVSLVGKASPTQVELALETDKQENLRMITDSIHYLRAQGKRVFFDAEHYFDGYSEDSEYALAVLHQAFAAGAELCVLCDTNGGRLPQEISTICTQTIKALASELPLEQQPPRLGIHCHNDSGVAVASSLLAVEAGIIQVQGTVNGYGERVGNTDLLCVLADLQLKMGYQLVSSEQLALLSETARFVAETMNITPDAHAPYSGNSAFAHKGGLHAAAALKHHPAYEHIDPSLVGNFSRIVVSELAGRSALQAKAAELGVSLPADGEALSKILAELKAREAEGYSYEVAEASLALYLSDLNGQHEQCFELESFRVITEKRSDDAAALSEATIKLSVDGERVVATGEGNGPVNALDTALRQAIRGFYPEIESFELKDYKVRVLDESTGTSAVTRVLIDTGDARSSWGTVGVSENIIEASWDALVDAISYGLLHAAV